VCGDPMRTTAIGIGLRCVSKARTRRTRHILKLTAVQNKSILDKQP
jgi:hypothetical protein